jgi:hypothetical protein
MNKEFYQRTKNKINKKTFTNGSYELYQTLVTKVTLVLSLPDQRQGRQLSGFH